MKKVIDSGKIPTIGLQDELLRGLLLDCGRLVVLKSRRKINNFVYSCSVQ